MLGNKLTNTAKLVIVKHPFQAWKDRVIKTIPAGQKISDIVKKEYANLGCDIYISVNGKTIPINDYEVLGGEIITLSPIIGKGGGKNILGLVAMVALAVVSMGAGNLLAVGGGSFFSLGGATWGTASYFAAAAVMLVGGTLISRMMYQESTNKDTDSEQSYSWSGPQTLEGQNNPIQMTYGKVLSAGQTIAKYINVKENKEYLNWLIAAGEGELTFSNIEINDNPYTYYDGINLQTRAGTNNQDVIPYFNDTYFTKSLGYELLDNSTRIDTAQGNATQGLIVRVDFQQGLYHYSSSGKVENAWVDLKVEYRVKGTSAWTVIFNDRIKAKQTSSLRKEFRVDNLSANEYEVRVQVLDRSAKVTSTKNAVRCWWTSITSIVYDDFAYPNTALIGVRALATDQINGSPTIKFIKERKYIWAYNPSTQRYEQKPASNPAWACYDMLHLASRLYNINTNQYEFDVRGVAASSLIYEQFNEWATFCSQKKYYVNIEITSLGEMLNVINENIACIGHGMVVRFGTKYGAVWYCAKQPVQMFGMGNIISGTFNEEFLQTSDRANAIEITYIDAEHDYNKETITMYSDTYDSDAEENATQITFNGITSYDQAYREGKYQLYSNKYLLRTISFEANIDAIACTIGDVILVSHDVPKWANSGRIELVDVEHNALKLPIEIENPSGQYRIMYRTVNDVLYTSNVSGIELSNGYSYVYLDTAFNADDMPAVGDVFDIALQQIGSKPFIVKAITRAQDFTRRIDCVEYNENLYNENYDIPPINYSSAQSTLAKNVTNVIGTRIAYVDSNGNKMSRLSVTWDVPDNGGRFTVLTSDNSENWNVAKSNVSNNSYQADIDSTEDCYVKIITTLGLSKSSGVVIGPILVSEDIIPSDVTSIDSEVLADGTRRYYWDFEYPTPNDIAGFKLRYIQGNYANWESGYDVQEGLVTSQPYETKTIRQGMHCIMIKAVDNAGQESENPAYCFVDFGDPLEQNVLYRKVFVGNGQTDVSEIETDGVVNDDGTIHARQVNTFYQGENNFHYDGPNEPYWEQVYKGFYLTARTTALAGGYFWLQYNVDGIYVLTYRIVNKDNIFKQYSTRIKVEAGDIIEVKFESQSTSVDTVVRELTAVIDVPDSTEHFENISISATGTELPIKTPNYYTTAVKVDDVMASVVGNYELEIVSRTPCVIKFNRINYDAGYTKTGVNVTADITWQGFTKEVVT